MAALAGALNTTFEKINHYKIGDGNIELDVSHIKSSIALMKITSLLFCGLVTVPLIVTRLQNTCIYFQLLELL